MMPGERTYTGTVSIEGTCTVTRVDGTPLPPRRDLFDYRDAHLEWGHGGAGAGQLALALLVDCLGDEDRALTWHHDFKWYVVARLLAGSSWTLDEAYIRKIVRELSRGVHNRPI